MQKVLRICLLIAALLLTILCVRSILQSVRFSSEKEKRQQVVLQRMLCIQKAQFLFFEKNGYYTSSFDTIFSTAEKEEILQFCVSDSLKYIPFSDGQLFEIEVGKTSLEDGSSKNAFEVRAPFSAYLKGTDEHEISKLQIEAVRAKRYPGVKVSSDN